LAKLLVTLISLLHLYRGDRKRRPFNPPLRLFSQHSSFHPNIWIWEL
jgi:hypothetical protein